MASLSRKPLSLGSGYTYYIQVSLPSGKRQKVTLGRLSRKVAETARLHVEHLVTAKMAGCSIGQETADWLGRLSDEIHGRLERVGLVSPRASGEHAPVWSIGECADRFIQAVEVARKPNTIRKLRQGRKALVDYFGEGKPLNEITAGAARDWKSHLLKHCAPATASTHIKCAKQFYGYAIDHEVVAASPFVKVQAGSQTNRSRKFFVEADVFSRVLEHCPDDEWRSILALARFGGLRVPSEIGALKWEHVDWNRARITVPVPKLAHLEGREFREMPLFKELRPFLEAVRPNEQRGEVFVCPRATRRDARINLRTQFLRILRAAGIEPWPRIFQNLRATRETELLGQGFNLHEVCRWLGNSPRVAHEHYLVVTDASFSRAAGLDDGERAGGRRSA